MMIAANNIVFPNITIIPEFIAFLFTLAWVGKYVIPRVNRAMEQRRQVIRQSIEDAEEARRRAQEAEVEYRRTMDRARTEARQMVEEAQKMGEQVRAEMRERAEQEYERIVSRADADIQASARRAAGELRQQVAEMVVQVVDKVVGQAFDEEAHRQLIDRTIAEVEAQSGATTAGTAPGGRG
jgi:F-type H+-transporting ATPase subunit b